MICFLYVIMGALGLIFFEVLYSYCKRQDREDVYKVPLPLELKIIIQEITSLAAVLDLTVALPAQYLPHVLCKDFWP